MSGGINDQIVFRESDGFIVDFKPSWSGGLAVLTVLGDEGAWRKGDPRAAKVVMRVLDPAGRPVGDAVNSVRDFEWNADGTHLAYCTGDPDLDRDDFDMTGTWVLDAATGETKKVLDGGRHVAWARFDSSLYILEVPTPTRAGTRTWRYDPSSGALAEVANKGIEFSPSGRFYFSASGPNYGEFDLFDSRTHESLLASAKVLRGLVPEPVGWLPGDDVLVFESWYYREPRVAQAVPHTFLYDARSDTVVDLGERAHLGFDRVGDEVSWKAGKFTKTPANVLRRGQP
jgi:hypothetical protein